MSGNPRVAPSEMATAAATTRPWKQGLVWLLFLGPFFFVSYGLSNWYAAQRDDVVSFFFEWEKHIPFLPWTIVPYWTIDLFYAASLLLARTAEELHGHARRLLSAQIIAVAVFVLFPLHFAFERPETHGIFGWMFDVLLGFDRPFNQAPSLHIALLVILWTFYARLATGIFRWVVRLIAVLIGISVLTTYQHHFIDVPTGALLGALCVLIFPLDRVETTIQRDSRRVTIGTYYLFGAIVCAAFALVAGGIGLWLLWPSCSLLTVAVIYWRGDPGLFRKRDGRMDDAVAVLLAPYLLGAWLNSRWWTKSAPTPIEIVPGVWLSRTPGAKELAAAGACAMVDCTAELPIHRRARVLESVPMLDLLVPERSQIDAAVAALSAASPHGPTLVFCALGFSRSACVVIAWMVAKGVAENIGDAIAQVRMRHPKLTLTESHIARLEEWHAARRLR